MFIVFNDMNFVNFLVKANPDPKLLGGKASNLIKLIRIGVKVPSGFVVNTKSYEEFIKESHLREEIHQILAKEYSPKEILSLSTKIKNLFLKSEIPNPLNEGIRTAFNEMRDKMDIKSTFSVRSSAINFHLLDKQKVIFPIKHSKIFYIL